MRRIKLVIAALAVMVATFVAASGPAMAANSWGNNNWNHNNNWNNNNWNHNRNNQSCGWYWSFWSGWRQRCWSPSWGWYQTW
jgi:hypothetical protein